MQIGSAGSNLVRLVSISSFDLKKEIENPITEVYLSRLRFVLTNHIIPQTPLSAQVLSFFFCESFYVALAILSASFLTGTVALSGYCVWFQFISRLYKKFVPLC